MSELEGISTARMSYGVACVATFGENLRRLRERAGFKTGKSLADAMETSQSFISKLENNLQGLPESPTLLRIAKIINATVDELLAGVDPDYDAVREERSLRSPGGDVDVLGDASNYKRQAIPILFEGEASPEGLSWAPDGTPLFQVDEWGSRPGDVRDPRAYLIVVRGDSMEPMIKRGMRAIISPNLPVGDGDLACVHLNSGERLIKVVQHDRAQGGWLLESYNPNYRARFVPEGNVSMIHKVAYVRTLK